MDDSVEVVIKLPKDVMARLSFGITYSQDIQILCMALAEGAELLKGHGRMIDADKCLKTAWSNFWKHEDEMEKKLPDYISANYRLFEQNGFEVCQQTIVNAPTIIEAEKDGE